MSRDPADSRVTVGQLARGWRWGATPPMPRSAEAYRPPAPAREFPTRWARTPAARVTREVFLSQLMTPLLRSQLTWEIEGREQLEGVRGPVVFVGNHASHLDTVLLLCSLPQARRDRTAVAAAADYFFGSVARGVGSALAFCAVPIERRGGSQATTPLDLLHAGWSLVIYPEGTRSVDGQLGRFRPGAAHLALQAGVPVVPVAIRGTYAAMPRGRHWPMPGKPVVRIRYGAPIEIRDGDDTRTLNQRVTAGVQLLLDEDRTDWYSSLRRSTATGAPSATPAATPPAAWRRIWEASEPPPAGRERRNAWR